MAEILTGHEKYSESWEIDTDASIASIQAAMYKRNPEKYGNFLGTIKNIELALKLMRIPHSSTRVELFRCVYYAMRFIDDIIDGDTIPPLPHEEREKLVESVLFWDIETIRNPLYKALAIRIQDLANELELEAEMSEAMHEILTSMKFDLDRIMDQNNKTRNQKDLHENFHQMDITGTIAGTAIIFWIDTESAISLLEELWEACRIVYNLDDFLDDINEWLINIPREDLERYGIDINALSQVRDISELPPEVVDWFSDEIDRYDACMRSYFWKISQWLQFSDWNKLLHWWRNLFMRKVILPKTYIQDNNSRVQRIVNQM